MKKTLLAALGMLLLLLGGGLLGLYQVGTDAKAYLAVSRETADYGYIGLSKGQTDEALTGLSLYLRGDASALDDSPFNAREKRHMRDVRALFEVCRNVSVACLAWGAAVVLLSRAGGRLLLLGMLISWLPAAACALYALQADFGTLFTRFHLLAFTNDLWLLNPETDLMIRMLPQEFFEKMALRLLNPAYPLGAQAAGLLCAETVRAVWGRKHAIRANRPRKGAGIA